VIHAEGPVLIIGNERDYAADSVVAILTRNDVPVVRWNSETLADVVPPWEPEQAARSPFRSVWFRQYLSEPHGAQTVADLDEDLVVRAQWRDWVATLDCGNTRWINPLWASRRAENKVVQLAAAAALDIRTPATLVTNDPARARTFRAAQPHGAVVKTLAAGYFAHSDQSFMFTTELTDEVLSATDAWRRQPLVVQQRLNRARDIRAVVVGDRVMAAASSTDAQDWRLAPATKWHAVDLPDDIVENCRALTGELGLCYAAIDLVDDGDRIWFLEANQGGEFQFIDRPLKLGIAEAIAELLADPA